MSYRGYRHEDIRVVHLIRGWGSASRERPFCGAEPEHGFLQKTAMIGQAENWTPEAARDIAICIDCGRRLAASGPAPG